MLFTHDTNQVLTCVVEMVNSATEDPDLLGTSAQLEEFFDRWNYTGALAGTDAELRDVHRLRVRLRAAWSMGIDELAAEVNLLLRQARALPQLVSHDDLGWHVHAVEKDQPFAARMAVEFAMAAVDVIRSGELDRLRWCDAADCDGILVDLSKNRSKRFCSTTCGNRENVAAYRARRRVGEPEAPAHSSAE